MADQTDFRIFRNLYDGFESQILEVFEHVEPDPSNAAVYSVRLWILHQGLCAAFGSLCNQFHCRLIGGKEDPNILDFFSLLKILSIDPKQEFRLQRNPNFTVVPFSDWTLSQGPSWWQDYNVAKHKLDAYSLRNANLRNVVAGLAALRAMLCVEDLGSGLKPFFGRHSTRVFLGGAEVLHVVTHG